jgi:hypothetical protein
VQVLNSKLDAGVTSKHIKSLILYEGSITNFDSRLHGFDIGTCLEVFLNPFYNLIIDDFNFDMMCPKSIYFHSFNVHNMNMLQYESTINLSNT